jgi:hypothetical protein
MLATGSCCLKAIRWFGQHGRVIIRPGVGMQIEVPVVPEITGQAREEWVFIEAGTPKRHPQLPPNRRLEQHEADRP